MVVLSLLIAAQLVPQSIVKLRHEGNRWTLMRNDKPYFVKGAAGDYSLEELKKAGGNSTRTWDDRNIGPLLDRAQKLGMTVTVGFWLGHKEHGFDYKNATQVKKQYDEVKAGILKYKDHPAVLMWALGNEMDINNDVPEVWAAVEDLAKLAKELDPNHPVMTVVAEIPGKKATNIKNLAPDVDILGVNTYGPMPTLPKRLKEQEWSKPYIVTEFGPAGPWESAKTSWGAAFEPTSTEKAARYSSEYELAVEKQRGWCLGSYAFLWGWKQETTPTWFGMVLQTGERLGAIDTMSRKWSGKKPKNLAPEISKFEFSLAGRKAEPGTTASAQVEVSDPDADPLTYRWDIRPEVGKEGYAGGNETRPEPLEGVFSGKEGKRAEFRLPEKPGPYRLYVCVFDGKGKAATANCPFFIKAGSTP